MVSNRLMSSFVERRRRASLRTEEQDFLLITEWRSIPRKVRGHIPGANEILAASERDFGRRLRNESHALSTRNVPGTKSA